MGLFADFKVAWQGTLSKVGLHSNQKVYLVKLLTLGKIMNKFFGLVLSVIGYFSLEAFTRQDIDTINREYYDASGSYFSPIPFDPILPNLLLKYGKGSQVLEIGSGPGGLAVWLKDRGYQVTCVEPAKKLAEMAAAKGLNVYPITIQEFKTDLQYDFIVAISSLIHVPKTELPAEIEKIANNLKPGGIFFVSLIEGEDEGFEDPTRKGKLRYFAKWTESDLVQLLSPYFDILESQKIYVAVMDRTFFLSVYIRKS
jgi:2-polyprenyl-3-methyl-5-hydroxy-6-metoxy-1,4-benzoquinol methylase